MSDNYEIKEYGLGFTPSEPQTDEEFERLIRIARAFGAKLTVSKKLAMRFAHFPEVQQMLSDALQEN